MNERLIELIITGVIALFAGALGSLVAPWINWGIEKRKIRTHKRIDLISRLRKNLEENEFDYIDFRESALYSEIRPYLSQNTLKKIERKDFSIELQIKGGSKIGINDYKSLLFEDLVQQEKKWRLI